MSLVIEKDRRMSNFWLFSSFKPPVAGTYPRLLFSNTICQERHCPLIPCRKKCSRVFEGKENKFMRKIKFVISSRVMSRVCVCVWGGGWWTTLCIKIRHSKPTRAETPEESSTLAENSRVFLGDVILDSDWPTKFRVFRVRF